MPQPDTQAFYDNLTVRTRRAMHRADDLGYDVDVKLHADPYGVEVALRPRTDAARRRLTLKGLEGQMIRATAPFVEDDPSVDCIAIETALDKALELHDRWLNLVVV